jgi:hypothetical protein
MSEDRQPLWLRSPRAGSQGTETVKGTCIFPGTPQLSESATIVDRHSESASMCSVGAAAQGAGRAPAPGSSCMLQVLSNYFKFKLNALRL